MNYEAACRAFGVADTKRQRRKWTAGKGRAFVLSQLYPNGIKPVEVFGGVDEEGKPVLVETISVEQQIAAAMDKRAMDRMAELFERARKQRAERVAFGGAA